MGLQLDLAWITEVNQNEFCTWQSKANWCKTKQTRSPLSKVFERSIKIRFHEADPAGIMYFANVFSLAHECFEEFIDHCGIGWRTWFNKNEDNNDMIVPIRNTSSDYLRPFLPGETYRVLVQLAKLSESSFVMCYEFKQDEKLHATVHMVHTFADRKTGKKIPMPARVREAFSPYLKEAT